MRYSVLILGHGEMGHAMEHLLVGRHEVTIWEKNLRTGRENVPLEEAVVGRDFVLFMIPAAPHTEIAARMAGRPPSRCIVLSAAKGIDAEGRTPAMMLRGALGAEQRLGFMYGPMIAEELRGRRPGYAELATEDGSIFTACEMLFSGTPLQLRHCSDVAGASWAAVLKNVYVPLIGAAEEAGFGDNARGFLVTAALAEMDRIATLMGGKPGTVYGLAGVGDLVTTATSLGSSHRQIGRELARGHSADEFPAAEGVHSVRMLERFPAVHGGEFPLFRLVRDIMRDPQDAHGLLARALSAAFEPQRRTR